MLTRDFKFRVWYKDTDQMGIVHHSNYICYYEAARSELLRSFGSSYADMEEKDGVMMPILEVHSKYLRPAHYDELITVRISLRELPKARITFEYEIYNEAGELLEYGFYGSGFHPPRYAASLPGSERIYGAVGKKPVIHAVFLRIASRSFRFFPRGRYFGFSSMENPGWEFRTILSDIK